MLSEHSKIVLNVYETFYRGYANIKGAFHFIILQTLWELLLFSYFSFFYRIKNSETNMLDGKPTIMFQENNVP